MNKKYLAIGLLAAAGLFSAGTALAANKIGTVTGKDGDVKDKVSINAEVTAVDGSHVDFKDTTTGKIYTTSFGPSWYSGTYTVGQKVTVEGVETESDNDNDHNFQTLKVADKEVRSAFEGGPNWTGKGQGNSQGQGNGNGQRNMVDANGDGTCDNQ